jgi:predicted nucleotidyltransferase
MGSPPILSDEVLASICAKWHIRELAIFGSTLRGENTASSDVDLLVTYEQGYDPGWPKILDLEDEFAEVLGRPVDIVEKRFVEKSPNYIKRKHILRSAMVIYAKG